MVLVGVLSAFSILKRINASKVLSSKIIAGIGFYYVTVFTSLLRVFIIKGC